MLTRREVIWEAGNYFFQLAYIFLISITVQNVQKLLSSESDSSVWCKKSPLGLWNNFISFYVTVEDITHCTKQG